jgi:3-oxoacyl-[acyl-carrier-protein] synthase III
MTEPPAALRTPVTSRHGSRIIALGHYLPADIVDNAEVGRRVGVDPEWIQARTGIKQRHVAAPDESVVDMAVAAADKALVAAGIDRSDVDTVITATSTPATAIPNAAAEIAARLALRHPGAFDLNAACAGFCSALACADSLIRSGTSTNVLVIGADKATAWLDWTDRDTAILFGDGAGAAVVTPSPTRDIGSVVWGSIGERRDVIVISDRDLAFHQDGKAVFRWAISLGPIARSICELNGVSPHELAAFVPHQANLRIVEALAKNLNSDGAVIATDVTESGNTIAATIPIALSKLMEQGRIPTRSPVLLFGFGAGLAYAGQVVTL